MFQFTPARGGRLVVAVVAVADFCFNSRPRVAGDVMSNISYIGVDVSIHARAWRATSNRFSVCSVKSVSIHARAWRATIAQLQTPVRAKFQFTPARGGRPVV